MASLRWLFGVRMVELFEDARCHLPCIVGDIRMSSRFVDITDVDERGGFLKSIAKVSCQVEDVAITGEGFAMIADA